MRRELWKDRGPKCSCKPLNFSSRKEMLEHFKHENNLTQQSQPNTQGKKN